MSTMPFPGSPNEPFFWGSGGRRRTPQDIALERERAMQMQAAGADFSPVGHWTQGLARLATGIGGALQNKRLDKAEAANRAESDAVATALLAGGGTGNGPPTADVVMQALLNPNIDPNVRQFAQMQWERMQPQQVEPVIQRANNGDILGLNPMTGEVMFQHVDPNPKPQIQYVTARNPDGTLSIVPIGPGTMSQTGGASPALPTAPVGKLTPLNEGGPTQPASGGFPRP